MAEVKMRGNALDARPLAARLGPVGIPV